MIVAELIHSFFWASIGSCNHFYFFVSFWK